MKPIIPSYTLIMRPLQTPQQANNVSIFQPHTQIAVKTCRWCRLAGKSPDCPDNTNKAATLTTSSCALWLLFLPVPRRSCKIVTIHQTPGGRQSDGGPDLTEIFTYSAGWPHHLTWGHAVIGERKYWKNVVYPFVRPLRGCFGCLGVERLDRPSVFLLKEKLKHLLFSTST